MLRVLLTGVNGQLGWSLQRELSTDYEVIALDRTQLDLADGGAIQRIVQELRPHIILNPAAYTAVDKAESEPALALSINSAAPGILAHEAKRIGAALVHYSTDYVFDGSQSKPYQEDDAPNPQSVYGATKLAGESAVRAAGGRYLILRTSWVYGTHGNNFLKTVLRLAQTRDELRIVADQFGAPTCAQDLARATVTILKRWQEQSFDEQLSGVYHLSAKGRTNWHAYAAKIVQLAQEYDAQLNQRVISVQPIATHEYPTAAKRPAFSVLDNEKIRAQFGVEMPEWDSALAACIKELYQTA